MIIYKDSWGFTGIQTDSQAALFCELIINWLPVIPDFACANALLE